MNLKLTNHFQARFAERGINMDHVKSAIRTPDKTENIFDGKIKAIKKIDDQTIEVVYCKEGFKDRQNCYLLITVYYK